MEDAIWYLGTVFTSFTHGLVTEVVELIPSLTAWNWLSNLSEHRWYH